MSKENKVSSPNKMEDEIILVNIFDEEVGTMGKAEAHEKGLLHRAFSVFIYNGTKILIQKRAVDKYHSGGLWANSCCSHPRKNSDVSETLGQAVERRLLEELGFSCQVSEIHSFIYRTEFSPTLFEYEYDHVFIGEYKGEVVLNTDEASEYKWIEASQLAEDLYKNPQNYASWFHIAAPVVIKHLLK